MGIYKFGHNTCPRSIRRRSNLGHIFREKSASYGPENTVITGPFPEPDKSGTYCHIFYVCGDNMDVL